MATAQKLPTTMRAWRYNSAIGGLESCIKLNTAVPVPKPGVDQHLIKIIAVGLNPVDHKMAESRVASALLIKKPATPGIDFAGLVVKPAGGSPFKAGQFVWGAAKDPFAGGMLAEYGIAERDAIATLPGNLTPAEGASVAVAAVTAYQCMKSRVHKGDRVFLNGGSGGTGTFGIQLAKAMGLDVTVTCSARNVELCTSIGADMVIDYTKGNIVEALKESAETKKYDLIVDNVFSDMSIYYRAHEFTSPKAKYVTIAAAPTLRFSWETLKMNLIPGILGGGKRQPGLVFGQPNGEDLEQIRAWLAEGKMKAVIDSKYAFEEVPEAIKKLKTGRAVGKIIVEVANEPKESFRT